MLVWNFPRLFGQCAQGEDPGCWNARRGPGRRLKHPARILFNIQVWTDRSLIIAAASSSALVSGAGRQMGEMWRRRRVMFPLHCRPARLGNLPKTFHRDVGVLPQSDPMKRPDIRRPAGVTTRPGRAAVWQGCVWCRPGRHRRVERAGVTRPALPSQ